MAAKIDAEIKSIIDTQYRKALSILREHRDIMDRMVKLLYEKETIYEDEIDSLFGDGTPDRGGAPNPVPEGGTSGTDESKTSGGA